MKRIKGKRIIAFILGMIIALVNVIPSFAAENKMSDIVGNPYEQIIREWIGKGYIKGNPDGDFKPNNKVKRAEMMAFINRAFGFNDTTPVTFDDVKPIDWYYNDVAKAVNAKYIEGYNGKIRPKENISRQEFCKIISVLAGLEDNENDQILNGFSDEKTFASWSKGKIGACIAQGFFDDFTKEAFEPKKELTRLETVVILDRVIKYIEAQKSEAIPEASTKPKPTSSPSSSPSSSPTSTPSSGSSDSSNSTYQKKNISKGFSATIINSESQGLANAEVSFSGNKTSFIAKTNEEGYLETHVNTNETYKITANGVEAVLSFRNGKEQVKNNIGEIRLGKVLKEAEHEGDLKISVASGVFMYDESQANKITQTSPSEIKIADQVDWKVGDIVMIPASEQFPNGNIIQVKTINSSNGQTIIQTGTPNLTEVFSEFEGEMSLDVSDGEFIPSKEFMDMEEPIIQSMMRKEINVSYNKRLYMHDDSIMSQDLQGTMINKGTPLYIVRDDASESEQNDTDTSTDNTQGDSTSTDNTQGDSTSTDDTQGDDTSKPNKPVGTLTPTISITKKGNSTEIKIAKSLIEKKKGESLGAKLDVTGTLTLTGDIETKFKSLTNFSVEMKGKQELDIALEAEAAAAAEVSKTKYKIDLGKLDIPTSVPGLTVQMPIVLKIAVKGTGSIGIGYEAEEDIGIALKGTKVKMLAENEEDRFRHGYKGFTMKAGIEAEALAGLEENIAICEQPIVGLYEDVGVYATIEGSINMKPGQEKEVKGKGEVGLVARGGAKVHVLKYLNINAEYVLFEKKLPLFVWPDIKGFQVVPNERICFKDNVEEEQEREVKLQYKDAFGNWKDFGEKQFELLEITSPPGLTWEKCDGGIKIKIPKNTQHMVDAFRLSFVPVDEKKTKYEFEESIIVLVEDGSQGEDQSAEGENWLGIDWSKLQWMIDDFSNVSPMDLLSGDFTCKLECNGSEKEVFKIHIDYMEIASGNVEVLNGIVPQINQFGKNPEIVAAIEGANKARVVMYIGNSKWFYYEIIDKGSYWEISELTPYKGTSKGTGLEAIFGGDIPDVGGLFSITSLENECVSAQEDEVQEPKDNIANNTEEQIVEEGVPVVEEGTSNQEEGVPVVEEETSGQGEEAALAEEEASNRGEGTPVVEEETSNQEEQGIQVIPQAS